MRIQKPSNKPARPRRSTPNRQSLQSESFGDRVTMTAVGASKGAVYGGAAGVATASLIVAGGALLAAASGDSIRIADVGEAMLEAAKIVTPASVALGASTGAICAGSGRSESTRTASLVAGGIAGAGTLGYAVYTVIRSLDSFMG